MKIDLGQFRELYIQESTEHIVSMESGLLELRSTPHDLELLNSIFRSAHSIKGGAGSFGLENLVRFTHTLESLLDQLRMGTLPATGAVIDELLRAVDVLNELLGMEADASMPAKATTTMQSLQQFSSSTGVETCVPSAETMPQVAAPAIGREYRVTFRPCTTILESGCNPLLLLRNVTALGTLRACQLDRSALPALDSLDTTLFYLGWTLDLYSEVEAAELQEVFEFVEHLAEVNIECLDAGIAADLEDTDVVNVTAAFDGATSTLPDTVVSTDIADAPAKRAAASESSIRVPIEKVDRMIDLVGELVIAQSMTEQMARNFKPEMLTQMCESIAALERSTRELHERVMSIRMLSIGSLFRRYTRVVYDIGKSTGKQVNVEFVGEETEIDKSMLELLADPMIHLIRNAVDHGIEQPEVRAAAGKSVVGTVWLRAFHRSGKVVIEIQDDGAGVDPVRVRRKAVERGLIGADAEMSDSQLRMLIFEPGFSTRDEVSDLSGRGVGMDVVKRNIQQMSGAVRLESEVGKGSCITIELPLTLAILDGLIIRVQDRKLVLPLLAVVETVSVKRESFVRIVGMNEVFTLRGEAIPLLRLEHYLHLAPDHDTPCQALIVIVEAGTRKVGLVIDEVLGQQQVVLKSLERNLHRIEGLMGATILGDGCVAPILDVNSLADIDRMSDQSNSEYLNGGAKTAIAA